MSKSLEELKNEFINQASNNIDKCPECGFHSISKLEDAWDAAIKAVSDRENKLMEEIEKIKSENISLKIDYQALENSNRKLNEANARIVEFEDIKKSHLTTVDKLKEEKLKLEKKLQVTNSNLPHEKELHDEITKLKKSREVLRTALEFYASSDQWNCTKEQLTTYNTIDKDDLGIGDFQFACDVDDDRVGGKKAREALEADNEITK